MTIVVGAYYKNIRLEIAQCVKPGTSNLLDVGCGAGYLGEYLKTSGLAKYIVGVELNIDASNEASKRIDKVLTVDLNKIDLSDLFEGKDKSSFDCIICADVLEHLISPLEVLLSLVTLLKPGGRVIISLPNVRHWSVLLPLIFKGEWEYLEAGIMDQTHLRFFTKKSAISLAKNSRLKVIEYHPLIGGYWNFANKFTFGFLEEFFAVQMVLVCEKV